MSSGGRRRCRSSSFERSAGLRPIRARGRGRSVRHLPLPDPADERARIFLLEGSRDRRADPPVGVVHHEVADACRVGPTQIKYLISFVLPRFCNQSLQHSRKARASIRARRRGSASSTRSSTSSITSIPSRPGLRRVKCADGTESERSHGPHFYQDVARMVKAYLASRPDPSLVGFLAARLQRAERSLRRRGRRPRSGIFPSFPQRYMERCEMPATEPLVRIERAQAGRHSPSSTPRTTCTSASSPRTAPVV